MTSASQALPPATTVDEAVERIGLGPFQWRLLIIGGLTWAIDAMEVLIAGFILPAVTVAFDVPRTGVAATLFLSAAFAGMFVGALFWGPIADRIGRRGVLMVTVSLTLVFGLAAALSPNLAFLTAMRFLTGFAIGGTLPADYALIAEYVPARWRGKFLVYLESFWAIGTIMVASLSWWLFTTMEPTVAWRWVLALAALPCLISLWIRLRVPESARFLATTGRADEARSILLDVARVNRRELNVGTIEVGGGAARTPLAAIWGSGLARRTLLLSVVWFCLSLGYYGIFSWLPTFFRAQGLDLGLVYRNTLILALAQVPGYLLAAYLVDVIGRRATLAAFLLASAAASFLFVLAASGTAVLVTSCLLSASLLGAWGALYAFTPELYPTGVRTTGMGWASSMARVASMLAPSVGALLLAFSLPLALSVYAAFFVVGAVGTLLIAVETSGRRLHDAPDAGAGGVR